MSRAVAEAEAAAPGWEGILDPGERILWQGRPDRRIVFGLESVVSGVFGLFFAGFALVWMILAAQAGGFFWAFGLVHFGVGLGIVLGPTLWPAFRRGRTWYTLTDRRAFVATNLPVSGRRLESYPITPDTPISFVDTDPASIHFAHRTRRGKRGPYRVPIGFERIHDGRAVLALIRQVQRAGGPPPE